MTAPKHIGLRVLVLVVLQGLCWDATHSQQADTVNLKDELEKQETIYHGKARRAYRIDRSLEDYAHALSPQFDRSLASLGESDRWLDVGAGEGQAILDYYSPDYDRSRRGARKPRGKKAKAVAMSIEDRRKPAWQQSAARLGPDQIRYLSGKRLRDYSRKELGRFQVITDVMGGFTYTENLSVFVEKVLSLLDLNGDFYTVLQDVHSEHGTNPPHRDGMPYLTQIANADGSELRVCTWLKNIACVNVTCELRNDFWPPTETFHLHKVCDDVTVPPLVPVHYEAGTPPERRFRLKGP